MKKRLTKFAVLILIALGTLLACEIAEALLPRWAFVSLGIVVVAYLLWNLSSPGKKHSYWYLTYMAKGDTVPDFFSAVRKQEGGKFDFAKFEAENPNRIIIMLKPISEKQYNKLHELVEKNKEEIEL